MKLKNKQKKAILLLYTYIIMLLSPKVNAARKIIYNKEYNITHDSLYASFNEKNVYIGKTENNNHNASSKNIYIYDNRNKDNPNMTIYNSYKITNIVDMLKLLQILTAYESEYPSEWNRSINSMLIEWIVHNICYYLEFEQNRTKEVDLDNAEEIKYLNFIKTLVETCQTNINNEVIQSNNKKLIKK